MRKFWVILLAIGLIMAFTMPVFAADMKASGSYVVQGYYEKNRKLTENPEGTGVSNIWQRLRLQSSFQVAEGLSLTTRFDAMEKIWGASRSGNSVTTSTNSLGNNPEAENIKFEHVYVTFATRLGKFDVGYQAQTAFGTDFMNSSDQVYGPRIKYTYVTGPLTLLLIYDKTEGAKDYSSTGPAGTPAQIDKDTEGYSIAPIYTWSTGNTGILIKYNVDSTTSGTTPASGVADTGYKAKYWQFDPYVKATFGPVYLEGEVMYKYGKTRAYESAAAADYDVRSWSGYLMANVTLGPAYVGAAGVFVQGDKLSTTNKSEAGQGGGVDFNPCLILFNYDLGRWNGGMGPSNVSMSGGISNARIGQVFAGVKPVKPLDIKAAFAFARADELPASTLKKEYGKELDITATYKIYDNLSYMLGVGYLWTGDFFKGNSTTQQIDNDYLVTHKLTLTF